MGGTRGDRPIAVPFTDVVVVVAMVVCTLLSAARGASNFHKQRVVDLRDWWTRAGPAADVDAFFDTHFEGHWVRWSCA